MCDSNSVVKLVNEILWLLYKGLILRKGLIGLVFQINKLYPKGKVQGGIFAITKGKDSLKSQDKQPKVKEYDATLTPLDA